MDRVLRQTKAEIRVTLYVDGVATDATGTPTITVTRADGTAVVTDQATTKVTGTTGIYKYVLTPTHTLLLDTLTAAWSAVLDGANQVVTTHVEVAGGFLFSVADARATKPLDATNVYSTEEIVTGRTLAEDALEKACERAFVPRYRRETLNGNDSSRVALSMRDVTAIRDVTVDGTALTVDELADVKVDKGRFLYRYAGWDRDVGNITVGYEHGMDFPPPRVARAALLLARRFLIESPINQDRTTSMVTDDGTVQYFVTAGVKDAVFDIPEANAVVLEYTIAETSTAQVASRAIASPLASSC